MAWVLTSLNNWKAFFMSGTTTLLQRKMMTIMILCIRWDQSLILSSKCRSLIQEECQSIDELMVSKKKARAPIWQYLPSKPHKWGFKIWARCRVSGVLYDFDVYVGKSNDYHPNLVRDFGAVVIKLTNRLPSNMNHKVYMDNLFSSLKLFKYLKQEGIWCVGTIWRNHLEGASLIRKPESSWKRKGGAQWIID